MSDNRMELSIAMQSIHGVPVEKPLEERLAYAMRYVREHRDAVFWMSPRATDDLMFRAAIAAVMLTASHEDNYRIERSIKPLKMLSAAMSGIPVDLSTIAEVAADTIPLMRMWRDSAKSPGDLEVESWG